MSRRHRMTEKERYAAAVWRQGAARREAEVERLLASGVPNPRRITMALDYRCLYGPDVDEACGGGEPMVDEWEAGIRRPTPEQMRLLADLTQFPLPFFYEADPLGNGHAFCCSMTDDGVVEHQS